MSPPRAIAWAAGSRYKKSVRCNQRGPYGRLNLIEAHIVFENANGPVVRMLVRNLSQDLSAVILHLRQRGEVRQNGFGAPTVTGILMHLTQAREGTWTCEDN
jgi:hypothetical protein